MPTFKELSVQYAKTQPHQVDNLTLEAPVLSIIPFEPSSHPMHNVYAELDEATGAGFVDLDSPLPTVGAKSVLKTMALSAMGGEISFGEDEAKMMGGRDAFIAKKSPSIIRKSGENAEYAILYNMIRAWAIGKNKKFNAGGSANTNYSILAIRFIPGETTGLYSPDGFYDGTLLPFEWIGGGSLMKIKKSIGGEEKEINGYSGRFKNYFGFQIANINSVAGVFNIDIKNNKLPTEIQMDDLLEEVRANLNSTYLLMHPKVADALKNIKRSKASFNYTQLGDKTTMDNWEGVKIIRSYNFLKATEANVTFE
jgi:hypothetical protein